MQIHDQGKDRSDVSLLRIAGAPDNTPQHVSALPFYNALADARAVIIHFYPNKQSLLITPHQHPPIHSLQPQSERDVSHLGFV